MSELRKDPITGRWVIISNDRAKRPRDFIVKENMPEPSLCPFCEGNESKTPPEILAVRKNPSKPNSPGWDLRVVPNKFPALKIEGELSREGKGLYDLMNGVGAHEVIIETSQHKTLMSDIQEFGCSGRSHPGTYALTAHSPPHRSHKRPKGT